MHNLNDKPDKIHLFLYVNVKVLCFVPIGQNPGHLKVKVREIKII